MNKVPGAVEARRGPEERQHQEYRRTAMGELSAALRAIERRHAAHHWHCWPSDEGRLWATSPHSPYGGSGTTVDADGAGVLEREIARVEHDWERLYGRAA